MGGGSGYHYTCYTWEGSGGKQLKSPGGSGKKGHAPLSGRGSWGRGLGLRGSHTPMGEGARKRKGLAPQGSAPAHGVTSNGHHSGSQGRALSRGGKKGPCPCPGVREAETQQFLRLSYLGRVAFKALLEGEWLALKRNLLGARDPEGAIPWARGQRRPPMRPHNPSEHLVNRVGVRACEALRGSVGGREAR